MSGALNLEDNSNRQATEKMVLIHVIAVIVVVVMFGVINLVSGATVPALIILIAGGGR